MKLARPIGGSRAGIAVILVLLVLAALLFLCVPFLMSARNASRASATHADRAQARLALDSGTRRAFALLSRSHPGIDVTPYFDSEQELLVDSNLDPSFWNARNPSGTMWDVEARDVAARIDWNSAPPQLFANALGGAARLGQALKEGDVEAVLTSAAGFRKAGFAWIGSELVGYAEVDGNTLKKLVRGLGASDDTNPCGPQPAQSHEPGAAVIDQRAFAFALWRIGAGTGELRHFDGPDHFEQAKEHSLSGAFSADELAALVARGSAFAAVRGGRDWQKPARVLTELGAGIDCRMRVDEARWFNPGATVRLRDAKSVEFGIVLAVANGVVQLMLPVGNDYAAGEAELSVLARRPVNVNTASADVLELVFANLQLRGVNDRIVRSEARELAALAVASRPFLGEEDFLRRLVLPAAGLEKLPADAPVAPESLASGEGLISVDDAVALYRNAHNANDGELAFSTVPLCFVSRDVYELDVRASVNAESGAERVAMVRAEIDLLAPQVELMNLWARQEDFDRELRLERDAPWWMTAPAATSRYDGASPPSRIQAHWGLELKPDPSIAAPTTSGNPEHVFASREDQGAWAQLWPSRVEEVGLRQGRMQHFDDESRELEGRYLPDQPYEEPTRAQRVRWSDPQNDLALPIAFSLWMQPRAIVDGLLLDVGTSSLESDRVTLGLEGQDLVLRSYDAAGDHPLTPLLEVGEARFAIAAGQDPGLVLDTWSHVSIDVRGTRPDQITMLVDGKDFGVRTPGLTRLAGPLGNSQGLFSVEDDEGFPDQGVVRIGEEVIEYVRRGKNAFEAVRTEVGATAGFGGRLAREAFQLTATQGVEPGVPLGIVKQTTHLPGTPVQLYGYSMPLQSNVSSASSNLPASIGRFAVAEVEGVVGGTATNGDPITFVSVTGGGTLGDGMEGATSKVNGLILKSPENMPPNEMMATFSAQGGYAILIQRNLDTINTFGGTVLDLKTPNNSDIGGVEVIRYSGYDASSRTLFIAQRAALPVGTQPQVARAFVHEWTNISSAATGEDLEDILDWHWFVVPISIHALSGGNTSGFPLPNGNSEFAQITRIDQPELTEWIRYDAIASNQLVRNDGDALNALAIALIHDLSGTASNNQPPPPSPSSQSAAVSPQPSAAAPVAAQANAGSQWQPYLGAREDDLYPITRAAREALQFRGVMGTYSHAHPAGTLVLPAFRVELHASPSGGRPGRLDPAFLIDSDPTDPGWPVRVHHVHIPYEYSVSSWLMDPNAPLVPKTGPTFLPANYTQQSALYAGPMIRSAIYVALEAAAPIPIAAGTSIANVPQSETRHLARLTMHPSGERPRQVTRAIVGGSIQGGLIASAVVDELVFGATEQGNGTNQGSALQGAAAVLKVALDDNSQALEVEPNSARGAGGVWVAAGYQMLQNWPADAGLIRIGGEILCYDSFDPVSGSIAVAPGGRGLLGTTAQPHEIGESVSLLDGWTVTQLGSGIGDGSATLPVEDASDFGAHGTVLVDDELIHYTRVLGQELGMPSKSDEPGERDGKGAGLFRGRYGTSASAHGAGAPVIDYPFRYWDRWADRADAPELAYFGFALDQPAAFWRSSFWKAEATRNQGSEINVLQRVRQDAPWDAEPDSTDGLSLMWQGIREGKPIAIGAQSDRAEWRVFVRYLPGAYDPLGGLAHGWKETPRLTLLGVNYLAPSQVLRKLDQ